jgi:SAM-dependent methyltransferase
LSALDEDRMGSFSAIMAQLGARPGNVRFHCEYLFDGIDLRDKTLLDIGAGDGRYSFYAACAGARRVVILEPEAEGSQAGVQQKVARTASLAGLEQIEVVHQRLQDYDSGSETFDVLLLHGSINHLDEPACVRLHDDPAARDVYGSLFQKLAALNRPEGSLIVTDCSRDNVFAHLGIRNPLARTIEWHKHQRPELWAALLADVGFTSPRVRWASFNTLRSPGRLLLGNRVAAYCLTSTFCLTMVRAPDTSTPTSVEALKASAA